MELISLVQEVVSLFHILHLITNLLDCVSSDERAVLLGDGNITYLNKESRIVSQGT